MIKEMKAVVYPTDKLLLTYSSETPYNVDSAKLTNRISDSFMQAKKDPDRSKPKRVFPHSDDPYFRSSKRSRRNSSKRKAFNNLHTRLSVRSKSFIRFGLQGWGPNLQQTYRTMRAFSRLVRVADEAAG
ncbi:hypothetical protein [Pseudomonas sp. FR229a]|uniref:hypothetical protein n=1 Tax=Pseudomonas sp. FR229a TaxID=3040313 RepID=UPI002552E399|nr:hypothetical protein [Pseudomonas sp. FR229a]